MFTAKTSRVAQRTSLVVRATAQPVKAAQVVKKNALNLKPLASVAMANVMLAMPAMAESGKLFDFNATLPIMAAQFLLLMVFLDKAWFTPVGKVLDERDELIRSKLASVKGDTTSLTEMQEEAEKTLREARAAASAAVSDARASTQAEQDEMLASLKKKTDDEVAAAVKELEKERDSAKGSIDSQVDKLAADILGRVLPDGVTI